MSTANVQECLTSPVFNCEVFKAIHNARVHIVTYEKQNGVVYYKVSVDYEGEVWDVSHRYSAFLALHEQLGDAHAFPPKQWLCSARVLAARAEQLEVWLQAAVQLWLDGWRGAEGVAAFLQVRRGSASPRCSDSEASTCASDEEVSEKFWKGVKKSGVLALAPEPEPELTPFQKRRLEMRRQKEAAVAAPVMDKETAAALCAAQVQAAAENEQSGAVLEASDGPSPSLRAVRYQATFGAAL